MSRTCPKRIAVLVALAVLSCGALATAQTGGAVDASQPEVATTTASQLEIGQITAGVAGRQKVGHWLPFTVELHAGSEPVKGHVEIILLDGDGVPSQVRAPQQDEGISLAPGERKIVRLYAKLGQLSSEVTVRFRSTDRVLAARRLRTAADGPLSGVLPSSATLVVVVSGGTNERSSAARWLAGGNVAHVSQLDSLPDAWWGYDSLDSLILTTGNEHLAGQFESSRAQLAAIDQWVRLGGRLVISVGRNAQSLLAAEQPLAALAPGRLESMVPLRQSTALETYAETLDPVATETPFDVQVPKLVDVRGRIESFSGTGRRDLPLVVRTPHGFGEIVFVAFDLDEAPLRAWKARPRLIEQLLRLPRASGVDEEGGKLGAVTTLGFDDLAGQLRGALDQFPGVEVVPFWLVALLVVLYIACIGPLDYFLVRRVLRRSELSWLTFGLTVLLFSGGALALAYGLKGREVRVNQLDVVDFDLETNLTRGTTWLNVFSPRIEAYDFKLDVPRAGGNGSGTLFSWFGLTGGAFGGMDTGSRGVGGMDTASRSLPLFTVAYEYGAPGNTMRGVPIAVWSSKSLIGRWWREESPGLEAKLADEGRLVGTLTSRLDVPLTHAVLIYGKWAYVLREVPAGRTLDLESIDPQTATTYLRHVTTVGDKQVDPPYDDASFDLPQIVEMMTAHELAGGRTYTGLSNQYLQFAELSSLVHGGRAVLLARVPTAATRLEGAPVAEDAAQSWTFYRFAIPVANADPQ